MINFDTFLDCIFDTETEIVINNLLTTLGEGPCCRVEDRKEFKDSDEEFLDFLNN